MRVYLACFDITDDTVRRRVGSLLLQYGERVQRSVFEIRVTDEDDLGDLIAKLKEQLGGETDLRIYRLCGNCRADSISVSGEPLIAFPTAIIV